MKTIYTISDLKKELATVDHKGIGFVPTMGALHAGHRSLVEKARRECPTVVVSVFVNPPQFNDKNDLRNYPRTPEADRALLEPQAPTTYSCPRSRRCIRSPIRDSSISVW